jgi:serine/threonine-protein kinase RsbW
MAAHDTAARQGRRARAKPSAPAVDVCLACVPAAATAARSAVVHALTGRVDGRVLADAELVVSELVTNSVQHAGLSDDDFVRVGAAISDGVLRLEVDNPGASGIIAPRDPDPERGGLGLRIVKALADAWGVSRKGHTRVWVELACWPATDARDGREGGVMQPPAHDPAGDGTYLNCPRCGLTIAPRAAWLRMQHCPRCIARRHTAVKLFASKLPTDALYAPGRAPGADQPKTPLSARSGEGP